MRRLLAGIALAALIGLGACGWLAIDRQVLVVKVEGQLEEAEAAQIRRRIGRLLRGRLLTMDVAELRERVLELSWPEEVSVRKVWPDTVVVRVARRTVAARWAEAGYLTPAAEIVSTPNTSLDIPTFDCALSSPKEAMAMYRYLKGMVQGTGLVIDRVVENEIGEWQLTFSAPAIGRSDEISAMVATTGYTSGTKDGGGSVDVQGDLTLMLGADSLGERMRRFLVAWPRLPGNRAGAIDYIDLRYANGMAVRWREPDTRQAGAIATTGARGTT